jgi:hypothetical protein
VRRAAALALALEERERGVELLLEPQRRRAVLAGGIDGARARGQALRIAAAHDVPAVNLADPAHHAFASTFLTRPSRPPRGFEASTP